MKTIQGAPPIVFAFKAESYTIMSTPEEIKEWETLMKERVGLGADISNLTGTCSECASGGRSDDCDSD